MLREPEYAVADTGMNTTLKVRDVFAAISI
jgi:hypothetical protein